MTKIVYVVNYVDYNSDGQTDGKARTIGVYESKDEALKIAKDDIRNYLDDHTDEYDITFEDAVSKLSVKDDYDNGCEWNINEVEMEIAG